MEDTSENATVVLLENIAIENNETASHLINIEVVQLKGGKEEKNIIEGAETKKYIVLSLKIPRKSISVKYEGPNVEPLPQNSKILTRDVKETIQLVSNDNELYIMKIDLVDLYTNQVLPHNSINEAPILTIYYVKGRIENFEQNPLCILTFNVPPSHFTPKGNGEVGLYVTLTKENEAFRGFIKIEFRKFKSKRINKEVYQSEVDNVDDIGSKFAMTISPSSGSCSGGYYVVCKILDFSGIGGKSTVSAFWNSTPTEAMISENAIIIRAQPGERGTTVPISIRWEGKVAESLFIYEPSFVERGEFNILIEELRQLRNRVDVLESKNVTNV